MASNVTVDRPFGHGNCCLNDDAIRAIDDELGRVKEIYFDDERWGVRYLIVETGSWLSKRPVLLSPYSIKTIDDASETIPSKIHANSQMHHC